MELVCSGLGSSFRIRSSNVLLRRNGLGRAAGWNGRKKREELKALMKLKGIRASVETGAEENQGHERQSSFNHVMEVSSSFHNSGSADYGVWDSMSALVRLTYGVEWLLRTCS